MQLSSLSFLFFFQVFYFLHLLSQSLLASSRHFIQPVSSFLLDTPDLGSHFLLPLLSFLAELSQFGQVLLFFVVDLLLCLQDRLLVSQLDQLSLFQLLPLELFDLLPVPLLVGLDLTVFDLQLLLEVLGCELELLDELLLFIAQSLLELAELLAMLLCLELHGL